MQGVIKKMLQIYLGEDDVFQGERLYHTLVLKLHEAGIAGATVYRGVEGYGRHSRLRQSRGLALSEEVSVGRQRSLALSGDLPMVLVAVDEEDKIRQLLPDLVAMMQDGIINLLDVEVIAVSHIEVQETEVLKYTHKHAAAAKGAPMVTTKLRGQAQMVRIYIGEKDEWNGEPLYLAILKRCRQLDMAGATVYRGLAGYGATGRVRKAKTLGLSSDLPIMITIVDTNENIQRLLPMLDEMVKQGLVVLSQVEVIKYSSGPAAEAGKEQP